MLGVKKLIGIFEGLSSPKVEPSQNIPSPTHQNGQKQLQLIKENSYKLMQSGEPGISRIGNGLVEKSSYDQSNNSLLVKICNKIPDLFKGAGKQQEKANQSPDKDEMYAHRGKTQEELAEERPYRAHQRNKIQIPPKGMKNDGGKLLGSNRNTAHLVGDDYGTKNVTTETSKGQVSTKSISLHRKTEGSQKAKREKSKSESTNVSRTSMQSSDDKFYNNEMNPKDGQIIGRSKSATTISSSGIYTGSATDLSCVAEERQKIEAFGCRTKSYVEKAYIDANVPIVKKYPSEPTVIPQPKRKTLTQENLFNLTDNSVGIVTSGNESVSVSQTSVFSSSEQETRDAIAEQTRDCLKGYEKCLKVPEQRRLKRAREVLEKEGLVIIQGNEGSGSSELGWILLFESSSKEKYNLLDVASHFEVCTHSKETVTILVDNAFGELKVQDTFLATCLRNANICKRMKTSRNVKLIFTVKHHIADQCKPQLNDYRKCIVDLEDPKLQLDSDEMFEISKAIVHNNKEELKIHLTTKDNEKQSVPCKGWQYISESLLLDITENALPSGFPKKFKQFLDTRDNIRQGLRYFTHPSNDLLQAFVGMKSSNNQDELDKYLTLSIIAVCGEKLKLDDVVSLEQTRNRCTVQSVGKKKKRKAKSKTKASLCEMEIPWWIEIINRYAKHCSKSLLESVKTGLDLLKTSYIKEEVKGVFVFAAPCVRNATLITIGQDFQRHILKLSDIHFFKEYISIYNDFGEDSKQFIEIDTSDILLRSEANAKLVELFDSGDIESFSKHKLFRNKTFAQQFLDFFWKTHDWLKILYTSSSEKNSKCVISCALQNESQYMARRHYCLAKAIVLHKAWNEKRKVYREWTSQKEYEVILHCCDYGDEDTYFELRRKYNVHVNNTCLQLAIRVGSYQIVEDIIGSIAVDIPDEQKCKCMELALFKYAGNPLVKRRKVVDALQKLVSVDYKIKGIDPVIHSATKKSDVRVIVALERFGGDINVTNEHGKTILHEAVQMNRAPFLHIALEHGVDQRKADKQGMLPIHECAKQNKPYPIQLLVERDCEIISAKDNYGRQPLHYAAINNSYKAANCLIKNGAEVDVVDYGQRTPLHYAAESGKGAVIHCLLKAKADKTKLDKKGQSPWILACQERNLEAIKRLLRDGKVDVNANVGKTLPIHLVTSTGNIKVFKMLLEEGANIDKVTLDTNDTVLHIAVKHGHDKLVKTILEIDETLVGYRNRENEVPLHTAARYGNLFAVDALLKAGADRSPINKRFEKPICIIKQILESQTNKEDYENYGSILRLLRGQKPRLETAV